MENKIKVASIIDNKTIVINRGNNGGIKKGDRFIIYHEGDEIFDPDTNESLGKVEIISGIGKIINVQEKISTLLSDEKEMVSGTKKIVKNSFHNIFGDVEEYTDPTYIIKPFDNIKVGFLAKKI